MAAEQWTGEPRVEGTWAGGLPERRLLRPMPAALVVDRDEVMRLLGYRPGRTRVGDHHLALVDRGIALARQVAAPVVSATYCAITVSEGRVETALPGIAWGSADLARLLAGAGGLYLVAATLGQAVDAEIRSLFEREEYALATIVDAAGSALVHALGNWAAAELRTALAGGWQLTPLFGPGYGDWPLTDQTGLVAAAGGRLIGLHSSPTCYLEPQKSLVGILGCLPPGDSPGGAATGCSLCRLAGCAYRVRPASGDPLRHVEEAHK